MLTRACTFAQQGMQVDILLAGRGKEQLDTIEIWKNRGYENIEDLNFVTLEDYLADRLSISGFNVNVDIGNPKTVYNYYKHELRFGRTRNNAGKITSDSFYAPNGFEYMTLLYDTDANGQDVEYRIILYKQDCGVMKTFSSFSAVREYFFSSFVLDLGAAERIFVFHDPMLDMEPGFKYMTSPEMQIYRLGINHGIGLAPPRKWDSKLNPRIVNNVLCQPSCTDAFIFISQSAKDMFVKRLGDRRSFHAVPNLVAGVDKRVSANNRDKTTALFVGRFAVEKQPDHLIKAFGEAAKKCPGIKLKMYGDGPLLNDMQKLISENGYDSSIELCGYVNDPQRLYQKCAVLLSTSDFESFGLTVAESLSNGCPVISYDSDGGIKSQLVSGKSGVIVPKNDIAALTNEIVSYFKNIDELLESYSEYAFRSMRSFDEDHYLHNWVNCLHEVVNTVNLKVSLSSMKLIELNKKKDVVEGVVELVGEGNPSASGEERFYIRVYTPSRDDYEIQSIAWNGTEKDLTYRFSAKIASGVDWDRVSICVEWIDFFYECHLG